MLHENPAPPGAQRKSGPGLLVKRHSTSGTRARKPKRRVTFSDVVHIKPICDDDNEDSILIHTVGLFPTEKEYRYGNQDPRISEGLRIKPHKCLLCNASVVEEVKLKHLLGHVYEEDQRTPPSQYFTLQEVLQKLKKLSADLLTRKTCKNSCSCVNCATELPEDIPAGPELLNTYSFASTSTSETFLQPYETSLPLEKSFFSFQPKQCEFCGKTFNTKDELKQHIKLHFKNEPETCELCGKTFQTEKELYEHLECHFEITELPKVDDYCTGFGEYSASGRRCDQTYQSFSWNKSNKVMNNLGLSGVVNLPVKTRVSKARKGNMRSLSSDLQHKRHFKDALFTSACCK